MASREICEYLDATEFRETRDDLKRAVSLVAGPRIAIDCGCGAGSDIAFLRANGFSVHGYDIEKEAVARCQKRFRGDREVKVSLASFTTFEYPAASLIVADASLFFCPRSGFEDVWNKITGSLLPSGIFVGSFLGYGDTMAGPEYDREAFWPEVLVTDEEEVRFWLRDFEMVSFTEHRQSGKTVGDMYHQWHIYSVIARKR